LPCDWFIIQFPVVNEVKAKHVLNSDLYYHYSVLKLKRKSEEIPVSKTTLVITAVAAAL